MDAQRAVPRWTTRLGLQVLFYACVAACLPLSGSKNSTVVLPDTVTNHGSPNLLCTPASWTDVAVFYLGNFVAHAATVRARPGEPLLDRIMSIVQALLFPQAGAIRGLNAIFRCAVFEPEPLQRAARAGALCMVVRAKGWEPLPGKKFRNLAFVDGPTQEIAEHDPAIELEHSSEAILNELSRHEHIYAAVVAAPWLDRSSRIYWDYTDERGLSGREIHGVCRLPSGYRLSIVPPNAKVRFIEDSTPDGSDGEEECHRTVSSSFSIIKGVIAILQTIYASFTLYRTRGDQLDRYGYAAFGLTVTPFLVMSIVNLIGSVLTPEYPALFMVRSEVMEEARAAGAIIDGEVGEIVPDKDVPNDLAGTFTSFVPRAGGIDEPDEVKITEVTSDKGQVSTDTSVKVLWLWGIRPLKPALEVPSCPRFAVTHPAPRSRGRYSVQASPAVRWGFNLVITSISIAVIGALSAFHEGDSTTMQRVWTMMWLSFGFLIGPVIEEKLQPTSLFWATGFLKMRGKVYVERLGSVIEAKHLLPVILLAVLVLGIPAFGGYVIVGMMLYDYGNCIYIR